MDVNLPHDSLKHSHPPVICSWVAVRVAAVLGLAAVPVWVVPYFYPKTAEEKERSNVYVQVG